jgi:hypothetical protein
VHKDPIYAICAGARRLIGELLNLKAISRESATELRMLIETLVKNVRVLASMDLERNELVDQIFITLVCSRLDSEIRKADELHLPENELPKYDDLLKFLLKTMPHARGHCLEPLENRVSTRLRFWLQILTAVR